MNGQQEQKFYLDNLNLDSDEMNWGRPSRNPQDLGNRVIASGNEVLNPALMPPDEGAEVSSLQQPQQIPQPATGIFSAPEPAVATTPDVAPVINPTKAQKNPVEFAQNAEAKLAQDGNIADFYDVIRSYGEPG